MITVEHEPQFGVCWECGSAGDVEVVLDRQEPAIRFHLCPPHWEELVAKLQGNEFGRDLANYPACANCHERLEGSILDHECESLTDSALEGAVPYRPKGLDPPVISERGREELRRHGVNLPEPRLVSQEQAAAFVAPPPDPVVVRNEGFTVCAACMKKIPEAEFFRHAAQVHGPTGIDYQKKESHAEHDLEE